MKVYIKTLLVMVIILILSYLLTLGQWRVVNHQILETFFSAFGTIYAIVVGFVIYQVTSYYNELKGHISSEINALQDLRDFLVFIDDHNPEVRDVIAKINLYVASVIQDEWPAMISQKRQSMRASDRLYDVMKSINRINPDNQSDIVALERLIHTTSEITTHRTNRLNSSQEKLPPLLKQLVMMLSAFIIIAFTFVPISDPLVSITLTSAITFAVSLIYFVILDLDGAYSGTWAVSNQRYIDLLNENKACLEAHFDSRESEDLAELIEIEAPSLLAALFNRSVMSFMLLLLLIGGALFGHYQIAVDLSGRSSQRLEEVLSALEAKAEPPSAGELAAWRAKLVENIRIEGGLRYAYLPLPEALVKAGEEATLSSQALLAALSLLEGEAERAALELKIFEVARYEASLKEGDPRQPDARAMGALEEAQRRARGDEAPRAASQPTSQPASQPTSQPTP